MLNHTFKAHFDGQKLKSQLLKAIMQNNCYQLDTLYPNLNSDIINNPIPNAKIEQVAIYKNNKDLNYKIELKKLENQYTYFLHLATSISHSYPLKLLLSTNFIDVDSLDSEGKNAIDKSIEFGSLNNFRTLIQKGINYRANNASDNIDFQKKYPLLRNIWQNLQNCFLNNNIIAIQNSIDKDMFFYSEGQNTLLEDKIYVYTQMYLELSKNNEEIASGLVNMPIDTYFHKLYEASPNKNYCKSFESYMKNFKEELENIYLSHQSKKVNKDFLTFK